MEFEYENVHNKTPLYNCLLIAGKIDHPQRFSMHLSSWTYLHPSQQ